MLSDRRQRVLSALIEEYVMRAMPVGSRTLIEHYPLGVSSATVRNELSYLEDEGYLVQPHASAGRIPTDAGYRAFVDNLLQFDLIPQDEHYANTVEQLKATSSALDDLLANVSLELSRFTDCLSVALAPAFMDFRIKQITLVSLDANHFLLIVVTEDAQVHNRHVEYLHDVSADELARLQVFLNQMLSGHSLEDIEKGLCVGLNRALGDPLVSCAVREIIACVHEGNVAHPHALGVSALLAKPEFANARAVVPVVQLLEDDALLMEILGCASGDTGETTVSIGSEIGSDALSGVSVVANKFGNGSKAGIIAVIGPTRMNYSRVISAVRAASDVLDNR